MARQGSKKSGTKRSKNRTSEPPPGPFVNSQAAQDYLDSRVNFERSRVLNSETFKLDRMGALVKELGDPHLAVPAVHIAGSKGKGSTCVMLESSLRLSGYTTGLFTSPHLTDVRERVRINGTMIDPDTFSQALAECKDAASVIAKEHGHATYFELITAVAFVVFAKLAVDLVILETGLGGRLDCTNVAQPMVVGLTDIQLEHTDVLGSTRSKIAAEKAGIMKRGVSAISVPQCDEVIEVFREHAERIGADLSVLGDDILYTARFQSTSTRSAHPNICVGSGDGCFEHMSVPLLGEHQGVNCGLALAIILKLREHGFDLPEQQVIAGLGQTPRDGRLELVNERPRVMIDGAHTPESVQQTLNAAAQEVGYDSMTVVFGCSSDKRIDEMLEHFKTRVDKVIFTQASKNPRAMNPAQLANRYTELTDRSCNQCDTPIEAIRMAGKSLGPNDLLLVVGSFYLAGEVKALFEAKHAASGR